MNRIIRPLTLFTDLRLYCAITALGAALYCDNALAAITYQLDTAHAVRGETLRIKGVMFNDTADAINWAAPKSMVLQWRNSQGRVIRSLAYLETSQDRVNVPVNNFAQFSWRAIVPKGVKGLQAVNIEGQPTLMALDTSPLENSPIAGTPADVPVVDAGAATVHGAEPLASDSVVAAAGASTREGPAVNATQGSSAAIPTAFQNFTNAISPYQPVYFDLGSKDGLNARYQISLKYRFFTPKDPTKPQFSDNFYLGYTQTALWDLHSKSRPFADTTYNPSFFWRKDKLWQPADGAWFTGLAAGVEHKSNGKSDADSRSLNNAFIQPEFNYRFDGGSTLTFAPRVKAYFLDKENPDYSDYAGFVDWKLRWEQDNGLVLSGLYQQGKQGRHTAQIEAAWPLRRTFLNMNGYLHVQYFNGYGETLLGYNHRSSPQVRVGLSLVP